MSKNMAENPEKTRGEIMRNAMRLVSTRGDGALDYANRMAERMEETGDKNDQAFWEKISRQVELLLDGDG